MTEKKKPMIDLQSELGVVLEVEIEEAFEQAIRDASKMNQEGRKHGFHVSSLSYDCLRNIQYSVMTDMKETTNHEEGEEMDSEGLYRTWIGTQLHLTPITDKHETGLHHEVKVGKTKANVYGHIDEIYKSIESDTEVIIDKKFVAAIPTKPWSHHITQVSYYAGLYNKQTGSDVTVGALLYFTPYMKQYYGSQRMKVFLFPIDAEAALKEVEGKVKIVQEAINDDKIIERKTSWLCKYCKWKAPCETLSGPVSGGGGK